MVKNIWSEMCLSGKGSMVRSVTYILASFCRSFSPYFDDLHSSRYVACCCLLCKTHQFKIINTDIFRGSCFKIFGRLICDRNELDFSDTLEMRNSWNEDQLVRVGRDGQVLLS